MFLRINLEIKYWKDSWVGKKWNAIILMCSQECEFLLEYNSLIPIYCFLKWLCKNDSSVAIKKKWSTQNLAKEKPNEIRQLEYYFTYTNLYPATRIPQSNFPPRLLFPKNWLPGGTLTRGCFPKHYSFQVKGQSLSILIIFTSYIYVTPRIE